MIVDMLRSYHIGLARMVDGSGQTSQVRWYRCAPAAKPLPFPTAFGSVIWESRSDWDNTGPGMLLPPPPGSAKQPAPYVFASTRYPAPDGQHYHGQPEWFLTGLPPELYVPGPPRSDWCGRPLIEDDGAVEPGGDATIIAGPVIADDGNVQPDDVESITPGVPTMLTVTQQTQVALVGTLNNYALGTGEGFRLTASAPAFITGFDVAPGGDGRLIILENFGGALVTVQHQNGGSLAVNRVISIDGVGTRIYPGMTASFKYDATSQRWRELGAVPFVATKGDLLTANTLTPAILPIGADTNVLTADAGQLVGMKWSPVPKTSGPFDLNAYRQVNAGRAELGERWYSDSFDFTCNEGPMSPISDRVYLRPFISPRNGHCNACGVYVSTAGVGGNLVVLGIYEYAGDGDNWPVALQSSSSPLSLDGGVGLVTYDPDFDPDPKKLYFLAATFSLTGTPPILTGRTTPPTVWWPLYGLSNTFACTANLTAFVATRTYDGTLPDPWADDGPFAPDSNIPTVAVRYSS